MADLRAAAVEGQEMTDGINTDALRQIADGNLMLRATEPRTVSAGMLRQIADELDRLRAPSSRG